MPRCVRFIFDYPQKLRTGRTGPVQTGTLSLLQASLNPAADPGDVNPAIDVHPDEERLAPQVLLRQEVRFPVSAVFTVVAVVAHHEIVPRWYFPIAFPLVEER